MQKDFDAWNAIKKNIDHAGECRLYNAREVWWCALGVNVGFEQDGSGGEYDRPVLILKGLSRETCLVIPLTTSLNEHRMRIPVGMVDGRAARALLSQMRVVDTKRLVNKIGFLEHEVFTSIRKAVKDML
jgi:mRNA interferase MazF